MADQIDLRNPLGYRTGVEGQQQRQSTAFPSSEERKRQEELLNRRREQMRIDAENRARYQATLPPAYTYEDYLAQFQVDPLSELYTGQRYAQPPLSREQFEYLTLAEKYGYGQPVNPNEVVQARVDPYTAGGSVPKTGYAYYQYLQNKLKQDYETRRAEESAARRNANMIYNQVGGYSQFMPTWERERLGITDEQVQADIARYNRDRAQSGAWDQYSEDMMAQNARDARLTMEQANREMQSAVQRGFAQTPGTAYQTPYAYQTWALSQQQTQPTQPSYQQIAQQIPAGPAQMTPQAQQYMTGQTAQTGQITQPQSTATFTYRPQRRRRMPRMAGV